MASARRALADEKIPVFAKIIAPRIGIILRCAFVEHEWLEIDPAAIGRVLAAAWRRRPAGLVAIAPIHEGLRIGEGGRLVERKTDIGVDGCVGDTVIALEAGIGEQSPGRIISEIGRNILGPRNQREGRCARSIRIPAGEIERVQKYLRNAIGLHAGNPARSRTPVEAGDRDHIGHAVFLEGVTQIIFENEAADIRKGFLQPAHRQIGCLVRGRKVVKERGGRDFDQHRLRTADAGKLRHRAGLDGKHRIVSRRPRQEKSARLKSGKIFSGRFRRLGGEAGKVGAGVERNEDRCRACRDRREGFCGFFVQLCERARVRVHRAGEFGGLGANGIPVGTQD